MTDPFEAYERRIKELEAENDRLTEKVAALTARAAWLTEKLAGKDRPAIVKWALEPDQP